MAPTLVQKAFSGGFRSAGREMFLSGWWLVAPNRNAARGIDCLTVSRGQERNAAVAQHYMFAARGLDTELSEGSASSSRAQRPGSPSAPIGPSPGERNLTASAAFMGPAAFSNANWAYSSRTNIRANQACLRCLLSDNRRSYRFNRHWKWVYCWPGKRSAPNCGIIIGRSQGDAELGRWSRWHGRGLFATFIRTPDMNGTPRSRCSLEHNACPKG